MLIALTRFLRRWSDDIARYGFLGALLGAVPEPQVHGRKAVAMRGTPAQRRLAQVLPRPAVSLSREPGPPTVTPPTVTPPTVTPNGAPVRACVSAASRRFNHTAASMAAGKKRHS